MKEYKLTIVIVTYKNEANILQCLGSLKKYILNGDILVIDNSSRDEIDRVIEKNFSRIKLIKNKKNIGFGAAANQGARITKGDYLLFLNPDTVVKEGCIEEMVSFLKKKKDAGAIGCKVLNPDASLQPSCGRFPTIINIILDRIPVLNKLFKTELIRQENFYSKIQTPDWISGVFFMVKKNVFENLGGFDERYFLYVEDVDFCYRAREAGYKIYYNPKAEIIHYDQGKSKERKPFKAKQMRKGFSIFFKKYKSPLYVSLWKTVLIVESFFKPSLKGL